MATGWTNRGKLRALQAFLQDRDLTGFYIAFVTVTNVPDADTNLLSDLVEIATGNGYTSGGIAISRSVTGFPTSIEDDTNDLGSVTMVDLTLTADGGSIPPSGLGISYAVLTDDNATVVDREVFAFASFASAATLPNEGIISITALLFSLTDPA